MFLGNDSDRGRHALSRDFYFVDFWNGALFQKLGQRSRQHIKDHGDLYKNSHKVVNFEEPNCFLVDYVRGRHALSRDFYFIDFWNDTLFQKLGQRSR